MTLALDFLRPHAWPLLLLAPVAWAVLAGLDRRRARATAARLGPRAAVLSKERAPRRRAARRAVFAAALLAAAVAHLGPTWGPTEAVAARGADVVVALDVSRSMLARDVDPDRLAVAKRAVAAMTAEAAGDRLGLVVFAGEARRVVPRTEDAQAFVELLAGVGPADVARGGTDLAAALDLALAGLPAGPSTTGTIVLVTDGEDLAGRGRAAAARCAARGVVVHAVGVGTERGGRIPVVVEGREAFLSGASGAAVVSSRDRASLRAVAEAGGGVVADLADGPDALVALHRRHVAPRARAAAEDERRRTREDRFPWPLGLAAALWLLDLGLPERRRR